MLCRRSRGAGLLYALSVCTSIVLPRCTIQHAPCTVQRPPSTVHPTPYTLHHPTPGRGRGRLWLYRYLRRKPVSPRTGRPSASSPSDTCAETTLRAALAAAGILIYCVSLFSAPGAPPAAPLSLYLDPPGPHPPAHTTYCSLHTTAYKPLLSSPCDDTPISGGGCTCR